jgi:LysR family transcriptional regulator, cyn operon transcriptional activator
LSLELYKIFYHIALNKSISKASEKLYITQPAVSKALKNLEEQLGCNIFVRTPKGVVLTKEGEVLFKYVDKAINLISTAEKKIDDIKNLYSGEVKIGASDTISKHYLVKHLKLFNSFYPDIKVKVICPTTPVIIEKLKSGIIDFGIINMPYNDDELVFKEIMEVQDTFITGSKYRNLTNKVQFLSDIAKQPMLMLESNSNSRLYIDKYFRNNNVELNPDYELGNMDLLIQFAKYDFGIACVIRNFIEEEITKGYLFEVKPIEKIPPRYIGITWLKNVPLSFAAKELINNLEYYEYPEI